MHGKCEAFKTVSFIFLISLFPFSFNIRSFFFFRFKYLEIQGNIYIYKVNNMCRAYELIETKYEEIFATKFIKLPCQSSHEASYTVRNMIL